MKFLKLLVASLLLMSCSVIAQNKKNVLVFVVDDLGYYDISKHDADFYETPNIDQLAEDGLDFNNAYVAHPRCLPSRYALQTGRYPARAGIPSRNENTIKDKKFYDNEVTIGQAFKNNGYHTFFAGKWHLGHKEDEWPQNKGYDINIAGCAAGAPNSYFFPYNVPKNPKKVNKKGHGKIVGLDDGVEGEYLTDRLTDETINFINEDHKDPFFIMLCHYGVHTPFQAKKEHIKKYKAKLEGVTFEGPEYTLQDGYTKMHQNNVVYGAMVESVDESLGRVVKALKDKGLYDNTIIVFTSDHGGLSNRGVNNKRELATSNLPLRAGKGHTYEGGTKVPLIFAGAKITKKHTTDQVTTNTDLYPTLLDLCDLDLIPSEHKDGKSIKTEIQKGKTTDRTLFWHSSRARPKSTGDTNCTVVRDGNLKMSYFYDDDHYELYDLSKDPFEKTNLIDVNKKDAARLKQLITTWKEEVKATI
ncbi:sulfatase [Flammeovirga kamogawensis]|uniref:Sulfatase n=1 Tax=Flammeovirga kamogawensis TaxID=373891 RepID=A0ABX8H1I7_9BACT|nr:sulfatase [Flammeovirga kamogawensis]MBB6462381.1 arylsulfatase A-like enzyme [Flammeovirga kamogawensis]QWG09494.1 sulfatase [Flammeovirga kamogawensis]TRX65010.1 sulfatase [Flammeovirga kamogawensis]